MVHERTNNLWKRRGTPGDRLFLYGQVKKEDDGLREYGSDQIWRRVPSIVGKRIHVRNDGITYILTPRGWITLSEATLGRGIPGAHLDGELKWTKQSDSGLYYIVRDSRVAATVALDGTMVPQVPEEWLSKCNLRRLGDS